MPQFDMSPMYAALSNMQATNAEMLAENQTRMNKMVGEISSPRATPDTESWAQKMDALRKKISADSADAASKKRGRESTVLTSPLTDEQVKTTGSVLTGK